MLDRILAVAAMNLRTLPARWGDWSYGLYLWAFPIQQTLVWLGLHRLGFVAYVLLSTVLAVVFAAVSWFAVERPALRWK